MTTLTGSKKALIMSLAGVGVVGLAVLGAGGAVAATGGTWDGWRPCWGTSASDAPSSDSSWTGPMGGGWGMGGGYGQGFSDQSKMAAAASVLGLTTDDLIAKIHDGATLADLAAAKDMTSQEFQDAILAAMKTSLGSNTDLTDQQRDEILDHLDDMLPRMVDGDHDGFGGMMGAHRGGMWS